MNFEDCYFLIPARKGSKGFPFKNRKLFDQTAVTIPDRFKDKVYVSTNDEVVGKRAKYYNFNIIGRPEEYSGDETSMKEVVQHFIEHQNLSQDSKIILLFLTYPERTWPDIKKIYNYFVWKGAKSLICCETVKEHPYMCFHEKGDEKGELIIDHNFYRRQDYPRCVRQSMFVACYEAGVVEHLHDLMFEKNTIFYKLQDHKVDVDYQEDYVGKIADERFVPREFSIPFEPFARHFERYFQCVKFLGIIGPGQKWLDCACGSGYGTNFLTNFADFLVGHDVDKPTVDYANANYKNDNCEFTYDIAHYDETFDAVFSVETIEHMPKTEAIKFLRTLHAALKESGELIITTPIVETTNDNPVNKFHHIEYSHDHFVQLLAISGFMVEKNFFVETTFTDGETKDQGYYKCRKVR